MAILAKKGTKVIVQGITGSQGGFHAKLMLRYGTNIVAGVTPGKGGQMMDGIPIYNSVFEAQKKHDADFSLLFVPAVACKTAALDALRCGLDIVVITEGVPVHDELEMVRFAKAKKRVMVGPNCPGVISPGSCKIGIMPDHIFSKGDVGVVSRSGTLTYEIINELTRHGLGQSTAIGIGGDPIIGTDFVDALRLFEKDTQTRQIVLIGEIGGDAEERAAAYIKGHITKPVVAYIAGRTAPPGKRMGHAGAMISGNSGTVEAKHMAFLDAGVPVASLPSEIVTLLRFSARPG